MFDLARHNARLDSIVAFFAKETSKIHTGRATPTLVQDVAIEAYGTTTPLVQLASISAPDPSTIVIQPWDRNIIKNIESAITASDIQAAPIVDGELIRISMPTMTEENRREKAKVLHKKAESARVRLRQERDKIKSMIHEAEERGDITEDEKFRAQKKLDETIKEYTDKINRKTKIKEDEIMTI